VEKTVGVLVAGNQIMVSVGVSVDRAVGVLVGKGKSSWLEQAARNSTPAARKKIKIGFAG
jgi:hypothetical protein